MSAPSTSTASLLLGSGRLPRFQSLRAPTKSPSSTRLRSCAGARPHLLAPISASALPLRVTAAPSPVVEAEDDAGRAVAVACGALAVAWSHRALAVGAAAAGAGAGEGAGASSPLGPPSLPWCWCAVVGSSIWCAVALSRWVIGVGTRWVRSYVRRCWNDLVVRARFVVMNSVENRSLSWLQSVSSRN